MDIQEKSSAWKWIYEYTRRHAALQETRAKFDSALLMIDHSHEPSLSCEIANVRLQMETLDRYSEPSRYYELLASLDVIEKTRQNAYKVMLGSEHIDEELTQKLQIDDSRLAKLFANISATLTRRSGQGSEWLNIDQEGITILEVLKADDRGEPNEDAAQVYDALMAEDLCTARLEHWISDYLEISIERIQRCKDWFLQNGQVDKTSITVIERISNNIKLRHALKQDL